MSTARACSIALHLPSTRRNGRIGAVGPPESPAAGNSGMSRASPPPGRVAEHAACCLARATSCRAAASFLYSGVSN